jgi:hypothetical protein
MLNGNRKLTVDLAATGLILYLSVWVYEFANLLSLSLGGHEVSLSFSSILPVGAVSISSSAASIGDPKILQVLGCTAVGISAIMITRRSRLLMAEMASVTVLGVYLASFYWEALPLEVTSYPLHVAAFLGIAGAMNAVILVATTRKRF